MTGRWDQYHLKGVIPEVQGPLLLFCLYLGVEKWDVCPLYFDDA